MPNPLIPKSNQYLISAQQLITYEGHKFSFLALKEMYREYYGEYVYWC